MKILLLADPASVHTVRWANYLHNKGIEVVIYGLSSFDKNLYTEGIKIESFQASDEIKKMDSGSLLKIYYLLGIRHLKKIIKEYKPDLIHAHYASSYGLLGSLSGFHPLLVSVWGADIYNFPNKSFIHEKITKYILNKADTILSTSEIMAGQTSFYTNKPIKVIPFGIDLNIFKPMKVASVFSENDIVIGTIKTLEKKYGIDYLIKAFKLVKEKLPDKNIKLLIVGQGSQEKELKSLVKKLGLEQDTKFTGFISPNDVPAYHNMINIYAALSTEDSESFGVAILEASAAGKPVVVTNVGGLPEVVKNNVTGFVIEKNNYEEAANVILKLISNADLRNEMGISGRKHVENLYDWQKNVEEMIKVYKSTLQN